MLIGCGWGVEGDLVKCWWGVVGKKLYGVA